MNFICLFVVYLLPLLAQAAAPKIHLGNKLDLSPHYDDITATVVEFDGRRYARIEKDSKYYYIRLQKPDPSARLNNLEKVPSVVGDPSKVAGDCLNTYLPFDGEDARVVGKIKITRVTSLYIEALHNKCMSFDPRIKSDGFAGLKFDLAKDKNAKIGVESLPQQRLTPKADFNLSF